MQFASNFGRRALIRSRGNSGNSRREILQRLDANAATRRSRDARRRESATAMARNGNGTHLYWQGSILNQKAAPHETDSEDTRADSVKISNARPAQECRSPRRPPNKIPSEEFVRPRTPLCIISRGAMVHRASRNLS